MDRKKERAGNLVRLLEAEWQENRKEHEDAY